MKSRVLFSILLSLLSHRSSTQLSSLFDLNTFAMFCNNTPLHFDITSKITGNTSNVTLGQTHYNPWELSNHHKFGNQTTAVLLGVLLHVDPEHSESIYMSKLNRSSDFYLNESYTVYHAVLCGSDTLFTIYLRYEDPANTLNQAVFYNIIYNDGTTDFPFPGQRLNDNTGNLPVQATHIFHYQNKNYKLVYGTFDKQLDLTDNLIFSVSEVHPESRYNISINPADTLNPTILNILTYNPGMLKPANYNDNEEDERAPIMHRVIPDNLDVVVFEEFFEFGLNRQMLDSLKPRYPYQSTNRHNVILIPVVGKDGGVRIISKYPILEERDISFQENGCIPSNEINRMANKGVKYVKINKHGQIIHIFGTHTEEQPCDFYVMANFIKTVDIRKEDVVVFAGDFNVDLDQFTTDAFNVYQNVLDTLHAVEPTYHSLSWEAPYRGTYWGYNHWISEDGDSSNRNYIDYILTSYKGKIPIRSANFTQVARVNSTDKRFWGVFDLGDHNPVYGRIELPFLSVYTADTIVCSGNSFQLTARTNIPDPVFNWYKNDTLIPSTTDSILSITNFTDLSARFTCKVAYSYMPDTAINKIPVFDTIQKQYIFRGTFESSTEKSIIISNCISTAVHSVKNLSVHVFPNPVSDFLSIDAGKLEPISITLYDQAGHPAIQQTDIGSSRLNVSGLASGIYELMISQKGTIIFQEKISILKR